jgi:hypothetical protein
MLRAGVALLAGLLAAAPLARAEEAASSAAPAPKPYLSGFCAEAVLNGDDPQGLARALSAFGGRPQPALAGDAFKPQDLELTGQPVKFAGPGAPFGFVDARRGTCLLVYQGAVLPAPPTDDLLHGGLQLTDKGPKAAWRKVTREASLRRVPDKFFLQVNENGFGLCAEKLDDLRLHDNSPVSAVRVWGCRLGKDERTDHG